MTKEPTQFKVGVVSLSKRGYDTLQIANLLSIPESEAYNRLHRAKLVERSREKQDAED